jgi:hypothetical protein
MDISKLLFVCFALIASSILVAPASMRFGVQWATATDISYLFLMCGMLMAIMTINAEKYKDGTAVFPLEEYSEVTHDIYSPEKPYKGLYIKRGPERPQKIG